MDELISCKLCPHNCGVNRHLHYGRCGASDTLKIAYYGLYKWEEPIISGSNGSGAIFFSHCNLKCIFCQNKKISTDGYGKEISIEKFRQIVLKLQECGAHNINLVTPTHYVPLFANELKLLKKNSLHIPIVYNTSSYENVHTIELLRDVVDIYLADFKYYDDKLAQSISNCRNYFNVAANALEQMYKQVGRPIIQNNLLVKGVIVRILILPGYTDDSKKIIKYVWDKYGDNVIFSLMNQYTPMDSNYDDVNLNRSLLDSEYDDVINYACDLGITRAFIQEGGTISESFIPDFNIDNI